MELKIGTIKSLDTQEPIAPRTLLEAVLAEGEVGQVVSLVEENKLGLVDMKIPDLPDAPVTSVNGQTGDVTIEFPVTSVNGQTGDVIISGDGPALTSVFIRQPTEPDNHSLIWVDSSNHNIMKVWDEDQWITITGAWGG